jgi:hypothetical protein
MLASNCLALQLDEHVLLLCLIPLNQSDDTQEELLSQEAAWLCQNILHTTCAAGLAGWGS